MDDDVQRDVVRAGRGAGQDRGLHIGIRGVDGRKQLVGLRFGNHGRAQGALGDEALGKYGAEAGQTLGIEQRRRIRMPPWSS